MEGGAALAGGDEGGFSEEGGDEEGVNAPGGVVGGIKEEGAWEDGDWTGGGSKEEGALGGTGAGKLGKASPAGGRRLLSVLGTPSSINGGSRSAELGFSLVGLGEGAGLAGLADGGGSKGSTFGTTLGALDEDESFAGGKCSADGTLEGADPRRSIPSFGASRLLASRGVARSFCISINCRCRRAFSDSRTPTSCSSDW
jgi:hypothetical protein